MVRQEYHKLADLPQSGCGILQLGARLVSDAVTLRLGICQRREIRSMRYMYECVTNPSAVHGQMQKQIQLEKWNVLHL